MSSSTRRRCESSGHQREIVVGGPEPEPRPQRPTSDSGTKALYHGVARQDRRNDKITITPDDASGQFIFDVAHRAADVMVAVGQCC